MTQPALWVIGWTVIHSIWIVTALWFGAALIRRRLVGTHPSTRYRIALAFSCGIAAIPIVALIPTGQPPLTPSATTPTTGPTQLASPIVSRIVAVETITTSPRPGWFAEVRTGIAWLWILGATLGLIRLLGAYVFARRLTWQASPVVEGRIYDEFRQACVDLGIDRRIHIATTDDIDSPAVFGTWRPTVLLPDTLRDWSGENLKPILIHELAHVQRHDWIGIAVQRTVECALFFHPLARWFSRWLEFERECSCDSEVVTRTGRPHAYARILLTLTSPPRRHDLLLAISQSSMVDRVALILNQESKLMKTPKLSLTALTLTAISLTVIMGRAQDPRPIPNSPQNPAAAPSQTATTLTLSARILELEAAVRELRRELATLREHEAPMPSTPNEQAVQAPSVRGVIVAVNTSSHLISVRLDDMPKEHRRLKGTSLSIYSGNTYKAEATIAETSDKLVMCRVNQMAANQRLRVGDHAASAALLNTREH